MSKSKELILGRFEIIPGKKGLLGEGSFSVVQKGLVNLYSIVLYNIILNHYLRHPATKTTQNPISSNQLSVARLHV